MQCIYQYSSFRFLLIKRVVNVKRSENKYIVIENGKGDEYMNSLCSYSAAKNFSQSLK